MPKTTVCYSGAPATDRDVLSKAVLDLLMRGVTISEIGFPADKMHAACRLGIATGDDGMHVYDGYPVVPHPDPCTIIIKHD